MCRMLAVLSVKPFPIRKWLLDANPGLLGLSLRGKNAPHRDGLGYAFRDPQGRWRLFRFGPKALLEAEIPGPVDREGTGAFGLMPENPRRSSRAFGAAFTPTLSSTTVSSFATTELCGISSAWDLPTERIPNAFSFGFLSGGSRGRPERLEDCFRELLGTISDFSALNLLLSDGENLYALCAFRANPEYFTLWFRTGTDFVAVASEPADEEGGWIPTENGELLGIHPDLSITRLRVLDSSEVRSVFSGEGEKD